MAARPRRSLKDRWQEIRKPIACNCGCGRRWSRDNARLANAHFLAHYGRYWAGQKGKSMGRKMGKGVDNIRRLARGGRESYGHVDRRGRDTDKYRSRPGTSEGRRHIPIWGSRLRGTRDDSLAARTRHGKAHDRAEDLERKAERATRADRHHTANRHTRAARELRSPWPAPPPRPAPARPEPARTAPARSNGTRPAPSRTPPQGRLAPANGRGNGTRPAPQRTGRTRT